METVTEDTYDLYGRQRSTSFNPGTAEHEASNTALGSFVLGFLEGMVYLLCDLQGLTRYNVAEVKMKLLINPRESQAQPQVSQVYCLCDRLCLSILSVANFSTIVYWKKD